ncbi:ankyrin repeat-containing domain protein [Aspergillus multicolor]|uniref:ankyrin repeat domain-containing protein n=1 Tax=Aspergillus multicolor TaxID=41759 RepID=UPI003CCCD6A8
MSRDHEGYTPLMLAARSGDANVVRVLLEDPNVPDPSVAINLSDDKGDTALVHAAKQGHRSVVERLLRHPKIDTSGALAGAAGQNRKDIVHLLLDRKIVTSKLEVERALDAAKKNMERDMHAFLMPYLHIMPEN